MSGGGGYSALLTLGTGAILRTIFWMDKFYSSHRLKLTQEHIVLLINEIDNRRYSFFSGRAALLAWALCSSMGIKAKVSQSFPYRSLVSVYSPE